MSASLLDLQFVLFLCLIGLLRQAWPRRYYPAYGALSSLALLLWAAPAAAGLITAITVCVLYPTHRAIHYLDRTGRSRGHRQILMPASVGLLLVLLVLFKVPRRWSVPFMGDQWASSELLALVGFSYFVFRAINFLHVQSILKTEEREPWTLLFFTLFPPTLTSGPIQKFQDFRQQVINPAPLTRTLATEAVYRITRGYFRKLVVAFVLNEVLQRALAAGQLNVASSSAVVLLLYLYFYFDFAGYSDIAIGFGLLIGIKVPENFRKPFLATTVSEFWRNWHITLVDWFRDNVFIPLGGMRGTRFRAASLAFLVMVLCGAWHGLAATFLLWGVWHGTALFAEAMMRTQPIPPASRHGSRYWCRVIWTNALVAVPSILFLPRTETIVAIVRGFSVWPTP